MTQALFDQAFEEVYKYVGDLSEEGAAGRWRVMDRLRDPDRVVSFSVRWTCDSGKVQINRAWRVQHCNVLGPYKGGLRFHPSVTEDTLRFLAFEQCFKNALTGLPLGGGKGGSDFTTKGKSDAEIMRFCQSFIDEYSRYGGEDTDVPAGDIGVGSREVGFLFGHFLRLTSRHVGVLTGKPEALGGIAGRTEATGYGTVRFASLMLEAMGDSLGGKRVLVSGAGNVAQYAAERAIREGATVLSLSNSEGSAHFAEGLTQEQLEAIRARREAGERLQAIIEGMPGASFRARQRPWDITCDVALPCATQNEIEEIDAKALISGGVRVVAEGANMPSTAAAADAFEAAGVAHGIGKAANAGGVAVSGLEMSQNSLRLSWTREEVDKRLQDIMQGIHHQCVEFGTEKGKVNYPKGANIAGFKKVADAIIEQGVL